MINNLKLYHLMCVQSCGLQIDKQMAITNVNSNFYTYFFLLPWRKPRYGVISITCLQMGGGV